MDTTVKSAFNVHIEDHTIVKFLKCGPGLYYFDAAKSDKPPVKSSSFISTVKEKTLYFSWNEIEGLDRACYLQEKIGWSSVQDHQNIITKDKIINTRIPPMISTGMKPYMNQ